VAGDGVVDGLSGVGRAGTLVAEVTAGAGAPVAVDDWPAVREGEPSLEQAARDVSSAVAMTA
jgi:hypothetical protein